MGKVCLHSLSDDDLAQYRREAEDLEREYRNHASEARLHQMMRKHVKREHLKEQKRAIDEMLKELEGK